MRTHPLGLAAGIALFLGSTAASRTQGDLLDRAVAVWAGVHTARASFEQTITNKLTGRTMVTTGDYQQERPSKLAVSFREPADERIVADGKFIWMYLPSSAPDQVIKSSQTSAGTGTVDLTAQFLTSPRTRYNVSTGGTLVVSGRPTHAFTLVPKSDEAAPFKIASVWIDDQDASVRQFEVVDINGVQRKVRMTSLKTNVPVDAQAFVFTVPKGARVVEH